MLRFKRFRRRRRIEHVSAHHVLKGLADQAEIHPSELLTQPCDILAPCPIEQVIDAEIAGKLQCRIIAEGANGPTIPEANLVIEQRNDRKFVIPDILCNSVGVIVSYFEWVQDLQHYFWSKDEVMDRLERALDRSWSQVVARAKKDGTSNRTAAMAIGVERVRDAKLAHGLFP